MCLSLNICFNLTAAISVEFNVKWWYVCKKKKPQYFFSLSLSQLLLRISWYLVWFGPAISSQFSVEESSVITCVPGWMKLGVAFRNIKSCVHLHSSTCATEGGLYPMENPTPFLPFLCNQWWMAGNIVGRSEKQNQGILHYLNTWQKVNMQYLNWMDK